MLLLTSNFTRYLLTMLMAFTADNVPEGLLLAKRSFLMKREPVRLHHMYRQTSTGIGLMAFDA
jgi:hypothetical protein